MRRRTASLLSGRTSRAPQFRQTLYRIVLFAAAPLVAAGLYFTPNYKRVRGWEEADTRFAAAYYALLIGSIAGAGALLGMLIDPNQPTAPRSDEDDDEDQARNEADADD